MAEFKLPPMASSVGLGRVDSYSVVWAMPASGDLTGNCRQARRIGAAHEKSGARIVGTLLFQAMTDGYKDWKVAQMRKSLLAHQQKARTESNPKETSGR